MNNAKTKIVNFIKRKWLYIWVITAAVALCGVTVWAAYTLNTNVMSRVTKSTDDEESAMFSSNYLTSASNYVQVEQKDDSSTDGYTATVYLYNYDAGDPTKWFDENIEYTLVAYLAHKDGTAYSDTDKDKLGEKSVTIKYGETTIETLSANNLKYDSTDDNSTNKTDYTTLEYNSESNTKKTLTLNFSSDWDIDEDSDICVYLSATPTDGLGLDSLRGIIGLKKQTTVDAKVWTVELSEAGSGAPGDYDGYNLIVSGSGKATIEIKVNTDNLEINPYFYDGTLYDYGETVTYNKTTNILKITADSSTVSRYQIQLYKNSDAIDNEKDWSSVLVKCDSEGNLTSVNLNYIAYYVGAAE